MPGKPTTVTYTRLDEAFDYFNAMLFDGSLPACLITWQRKRTAYGYFSPHRFRDLYGDQKTDEIALNPQGFNDRTQAEILSTLVHEMVHLWQEHQGKPSRKCYHNRQWASKMDEVGLTPTHTGLPGGNRTGQRMTHIIRANGPFEEACKALLKRGPFIQWADQPDEETPKKKASKTKYSCPTCDLNAWAKPDVHLVCGDCEEPMKPEIEEGDDDED
jgi:hypothetical protein